MATQQQEQAARTKERKRLQEKRSLIAVIAILFLIGGAMLWILNAQGIIQGSWSSILLIIFTVLGVIIGLFQWLFPVTATPSQQSIAPFGVPLLPQASPTAPPVPSMPPITVHVPSIDHPHPSQSGSLDKATYRGILGVPPPTDPRTIQQREKAVKEVYAKLIQPDTTAVVLTGIGGVGKSTLAALVYRYAEEQRRTGNGPFTAEAIWLNIDPAVAMTDLAGNLFEVLGKSLPDFNHLSLQNQAMALFNVLNTTDQPRLVIMDQFENLLDWETGHALADRPGVGEWLDAINSQQCTCRVLLTSRPWPQGTHEYPPTYMREYFVKGLEVTEGIELLRKLRIEATETELRTIVEQCEGHAFALTLLASLLRNRNLSLAAFFKDPLYAQIWTGNVARNLLDCIYKGQLNEEQRKLLLAFSVYREPVHLSVAQALLDFSDEVPKVQVQSALDALLTQHLLQATGEGCYQLHVIVANYARSHFVEHNEQANQQAVGAAHTRAAQHYVEYAAMNCPPKEKRRQGSDVEPLIEAIWHWCQAGQWQQAYNLMEQEGIFSGLKHWGGNTTLLELYELLFPLDKWHPEPSQEARIYHHLGVIYRMLGRMERAREYLEKALHIYEEQSDILGEGMTLNDLGRVYAELGRMERARGDYEQALHKYREQGDLVGEGCTLNNLGWVYITLGQDEQAQDYYERALSIFTEVGDRKGEAEALNNLGRVYEDLGNMEQAQDYYERALSIFRDVGSRKGEGWSLNNLAKAYRKLGQNDQALKCLEQALSIRREVDRRGEGRTLKNLGTVYESLGQKQRAMDYYKEALSINREVEDYEGQGKTLRNMGTLYLKQQRYDVALASLLLAANILKEVQSSYCDESQRGIDTLREAIGEEQFSTLLARVEPQAHQIVEQALDERDR